MHILKEKVDVFSGCLVWFDLLTLVLNNLCFFVDIC